MIRDAPGEGLGLGGGDHKRLPGILQTPQHLGHARIGGVLVEAPVLKILPVDFHGPARVRVAHAHDAPEGIVQRRPDENPQRLAGRVHPEAPQRVQDRIDDPRFGIRKRPVQIKKNGCVVHAACVRRLALFRNGKARAERHLGTRTKTRPSPRGKPPPRKRLEKPGKPACGRAGHKG